MIILLKPSTVYTQCSCTSFLWTWKWDHTQTTQPIDLSVRAVLSRSVTRYSLWNVVLASFGISPKVSAILGFGIRRKPKYWFRLYTRVQCFATQWFLAHHFIFLKPNFTQQLFKMNHLWRHTWNKKTEIYFHLSVFRSSKSLVTFICIVILSFFIFVHIVTYFWWQNDSVFGGFG